MLSVANKTCQLRANTTSNLSWSRIVGTRTSGREVHGFFRWSDPVASVQVVVEIGVAVSVDEVIVGMSTLTLITSSAAVLLISRWVLDWTGPVAWAVWEGARSIVTLSRPVLSFMWAEGIWESGALRAHS
jgi:hypothetical protein